MTREKSERFKLRRGYGHALAAYCEYQRARETAWCDFLKSLEWGRDYEDQQRYKMGTWEELDSGVKLMERTIHLPVFMGIRTYTTVVEVIANKGDVDATNKTLRACP